MPSAELQYSPWEGLIGKVRKHLPFTASFQFRLSERSSSTDIVQQVPTVHKSHALISTPNAHTHTYTHTHIHTHIHTHTHTSRQTRTRRGWSLRGLVSSLLPRMERRCRAMTACCSREQCTSRERIRG